METTSTPGKIQQVNRLILPALQVLSDKTRLGIIEYLAICDNNQPVAASEIKAQLDVP
jgi:hypothetical protein